MKTNHSFVISAIRKVYRRQLLAPVCYLLILLALWYTAPISDLLLPVRAVAPDSFDYELHNRKYTYISTTLTDLHFTGYTQKFFGYTDGYYYYMFHDNTCIFILLSPKTCHDGAARLEKVTVRVRVEDNFSDYQMLTEQLADDLNWTASNLRGLVPNYLLSEPGFNKFASMLLLGMFFFSAIYALLHALLCIAYICLPLLSLPCRQLARYGNVKKLLAHAEAELRELPRFSTQKIYITRHFFLFFTKNQAVILPVREIIWVYASSKPALFLRRFSHTLHITANKRLYLHCTKIRQSERMIQKTIYKLHNANPKILVGFGEDQLKQVQKRLGVPALVLKAKLHKRA